VRSSNGAFGPEGSAGHLKTVNGQLTCVADRASTDAADARSVNDWSAVEAAYEEYSRDLENAWRNPY
jgi:hypothetical protein